MCSTLCLRLIALACMCILCSASSKCSLSHEAEMIIDITSRRNGTGHWLSQVGVEHGPGQSDSKKWSFGVKYLTSKCDASQDSHTIVVNVVASPARVGPDYVFYPDLGHYKFHPVATTWSRARQICEGEGAHLAVIDSLQEVNKMQEMYTWYPRSTNIGSTDADHAWVGFHDLAIEGNFVTIFGEPFNKSGILRWTSGNPDRSSGLEDCGGFHRSITGGVVDVPCDWKLSFIYKGRRRLPVVSRRDCVFASIKTREPMLFTDEATSEIRFQKPKKQLGSLANASETLESTGFMRWVPSQPNDEYSDDCLVAHKENGGLEGISRKAGCTVICEYEICT